MAPVLIFIMIGSLANFLMIVLYPGPYPGRVSWILWMYTMGTVALARLTIEQSRSYSLGYAVALGAASLLVMSRFFGSPIFTAFILIVIGYLADRIVHDCTIIDEDRDASGQGIIDSGKLFLRRAAQPADAAGPHRETSDKQLDDQAATEADADRRPVKKRRRPPPEQPGRTVLYLAIGALPLYGIGQFFIAGDSWRRSILFLLLYLFASLSLLVTTSFLGLRRYLRQRQAEMPRHVTVAWLGGGIVMVAAILVMGYAVPLPGRAVASFETPSWMASIESIDPSRFGWGNEGTRESADGSRRLTSASEDASDAPPGDAAGSGGKPSDTESGQRSEGPSGQASDPGDARSGSSDSKSGSKSSQQNPSDNQGGKNDPASRQANRRGGQQQENSSSTSRDAGKTSNDVDGSKASGDANGRRQDGGRSQTDGDGTSESENGRQGSERGRSSETGNRDSDPVNGANNDDPTRDTNREPENSDSSGDARSKENSGEGDDDKGASETRSNSSTAEGRNGMFSSLVPLVRFLFVILLVAVVLFFVWMYRDELSQWWADLWGRKPGSTEAAEPDRGHRQPQPVPARPFSSFRNPIGNEEDPGRVVVVTFQAFEAWTREQGWTRGKEETPTEFVRRVGRALPQISQPAGQVVDAYNRVVYGRGAASSRDVAAAERIWASMRESIA